MHVIPLRQQLAPLSLYEETGVLSTVKTIQYDRICMIHRFTNNPLFGHPLQSVTPIHNSAGKLTHYVGIQSDITELVNHKKAELAARHSAVQAAAATEAKSQVCSAVRMMCGCSLNSQ